ncbi:MAG: hypothetical protein IKX31_05515 [Muribaculaceae bacterium]|nr:hypothetical protein [Muribaculaceae bacterium]
MKKTILSLLLMLVAVIAAQAQSLTGKTWVYNIPDENAQAQLVFDYNGTMVMTLSGDVDSLFYLKAILHGTYKLRDKKLFLEFDSDKVDVDISLIEHDNSSLEVDLVEQLVESYKQNLKESIINDKSIFEGMRINKWTESQLELEDCDGDTMLFEVQ